MFICIRFRLFTLNKSASAAKAATERSEGVAGAERYHCPIPPAEG